MTAGSPLRIDGWVLPPETTAVPDRLRTVASEGTAAVRWIEPSAEMLHAVAESLRSAQVTLARKRWRDIAGVVGRVAERLLDPRDSLRERALRHLCETTSLSAAMATLVLDGMARDWRSDRLIAAVEAEPPLAEALDGWTVGGPAAQDVGRGRAPSPAAEPGQGVSEAVGSPKGPRLRARGYPLTLHLGSGTVPGVTAMSMIRALLVKSAAWAKPGLGDVALTTALAVGLAEADPEVAAAVAVTYWPGDETPPGALGVPDLVVAYGGDEAISRVRSEVRPTTPVVAYHHRLSFSAVARQALTVEQAQETALAVALAVAVFDQRGCVSPHLVFVEVGGEVDPRSWAARLANACRRVAGSLPPGEWTTAEASAVQQLRGAMEMKAAVDPTASVVGGEDLAWTVVVDADALPESPCAGRTIRVRPVEDLTRIPPLLGHLAPVLQTMGFAGPRDRVAGLAEALSEIGVTRVCRIEDQAFPPPWWKHDGSNPLSALLRWTELDVGA